MLAMVKQLRIVDEAVREGNWNIRYTLNTEIWMVRLRVSWCRPDRALLLGASLAFNMKVIAYDPYIEKTQNIEFIELTDKLENIFKQRILFLCIIYTKETHHLVNERFLSLMKSNSF